METYLSDQAIAFLWAVVLGGALGGYYDLFRILRILRGRDRPVMVFIEDLLFALGAALSTALCFTLTNHGQVRLFLLVGEALGFLIWFHSLGTLIARTARLCRRILSFFGRKIKEFMNFLKKPFLFLKRCVIMYVYDLKERRRLHETGRRRNRQARRKAQARSKDEPRRSGAFGRWRHLFRHHHAGTRR